MPVRKLTISVSEYDDDIKTIVAPALQGGLDVTFKKYSNLSDLSDYSGGDKYPLTLVGHANGVSMKIGIGLGDRVDGETVADQLLAKGLDAKTFPFCLIAGCSGAASKADGLYIKIADKLGIPTVASSTPIKISRAGEKVTLTPQSSGTWRVYFPASEERFDLQISGRCDNIRSLLDKQEFQCHQGVA